MTARKKEAAKRVRKPRKPPKDKAPEQPEAPAVVFDRSQRDVDPSRHHTA